jgi:hypothetical protein
LAPSEFAIGALRLAAMVLPAAYSARALRRRCLGSLETSLAVLVDCVLSVSLLLVAAEALGLAGRLQSGALIALLVLVAVASHVLASRRCSPGRERRACLGGREGTGAATGRARAPCSARAETIAVAVALVVVGAQWCLQTANELGSGMSNFDTLWYHMPFAARFAQTHSITGIQFTQADPFVAYYPANSELLHALGIEAIGSDVLSPVLNLLWLALALLACWCFGARWGVRRLTLLAGCVVFSLPVLSTTQPGEAFNDAFGLAALLAAAALLANAAGRGAAWAGLVGLALGLAVGTKFTFLVPAAVLALATAQAAPAGLRTRAAAMTVAGLAVTGGWWYVRDTIEAGNPLGLAISVGPLRLPGPRSPLAEALQRTVISQVSDVSLWGSRFLPGLTHTLGVLWPLVVLACVAVSVVGLVWTRDPAVRGLALATLLSGIVYLFLPTGASAIQHGENLFEVNLRYATPAVALGLLLVPAVTRMRAPRLVGVLSGPLLATLVVAQLEPGLWPAQLARHAVFIALGASVGAALVLVRRARGRLGVEGGASAALVAAGLALLVLAGGFVVQRHYFARRYRLGDPADRGLGEIDRWAQHVSNARIALYGTLLQYPLYGARDTNRVDYLGEATGDGGYRPVQTCRTWRSLLARGGYSWVVIVQPGPTRPLPVEWTQADPEARLVLHPEAGAFVFRMVGRTDPTLCGNRGS